MQVDYEWLELLRQLYAYLASGVGIALDFRRTECTLIFSTRSQLLWKVPVLTLLQT